MSYEDSTQKLLRDFESNPEILATMREVMGSRESAIQAITLDTAPNYIMPDQPARPGQVAQGLSEWHSSLQTECREKYIGLTADEDGPLLSREEANADEGMQTLQAIRRGVKAARSKNSQRAKGTSGPPKPNLSLLPMFMLED